MPWSCCRVSRQNAYRPCCRSGCQSAWCVSKNAAQVWLTWWVIACRHDKRLLRCGSASSKSISNGKWLVAGLHCRACTHCSGLRPAAFAAGIWATAWIRSGGVMRPCSQASCCAGRDAKTCTSPSNAMRAATCRSGMPIRDQCGLTAIARSRGHAGAIIWHALAHAASICACVSGVCTSAARPGVTATPASAQPVVVFIV